MYDVLKFIYHLNVGAQTSILMTNQHREPPRPGNITMDVILGDYGVSLGKGGGVAFISDSPPTAEAVG